MKNEPTKQRLCELFEYRDGVLYWVNPPLRRPQLVGRVAGYRGDRGYWKVKVDGHLYGRHQLVFIMHHGRAPTYQIDHINRTPSDDRIENLRDVPHQQNMWNKAPKGYRWSMTNKKWQANIMAHGKLHHIGHYDTEEAAHEAYLSAKKVHHA